MAPTNAYRRRKTATQQTRNAFLPGPRPSAPGAPAFRPPTQRQPHGSPQDWANLQNQVYGPPKPPAAPGPPTPPPPQQPVQPFSTGGDLMGYADAYTQWQNTIAGANSSVESARINTDYEKTNVEKGRVQNRAAEDWGQAARGLQQSSIRDGALYDIDAVAKLRSDYLDQVFANAKSTAETTIKNIEDWWGNWQKGYNLKQVENAATVSANSAPPPEAAPAPGAPQAPGADPMRPFILQIDPNAPPGTKIAILGNKRYLVYPDGRKVPMPGTSK